MAKTAIESVKNSVWINAVFKAKAKVFNICLQTFVLTTNVIISSGETTQ